VDINAQEGALVTKVPSKPIEEEDELRLETHKSSQSLPDMSNYKDIFALRHKLGDTRNRPWLGKLFKPATCIEQAAVSM
jgi:hypothetical protein